MAAETVHIHLRNCPGDVKNIIEDEQARLKLYEDKKLKQEFVFYEVVRDWYRLRNLETQMQAKLIELETKLLELGKSA